MSLTGALIIGGITLVGIILVVVPESRVLFRGFMTLFVENKAKTPEGAEMVYTEAIRIQQEKYNEASNVYQTLVGKKATLDKKMKELEDDIAQAEKKCIYFVKTDNEAQAKLFSQMRMEKISEYQVYERQMTQLAERVVEAKEVTKSCEKQLKELMRRKSMDVAQLKLDTQLAESYDALDELKRTTSTDKLLGIVKEGVEERHEKAVGARAVYESKASTRIARADKDFESLAADTYLENLKKQIKRGRIEAASGKEVYIESKTVEKEKQRR